MGIKKLQRDTLNKFNALLVLIRKIHKIKVWQHTHSSLRYSQNFAGDGDPRSRDTNIEVEGINYSVSASFSSHLKVN